MATFGEKVQNFLGFIDAAYPQLSSEITPAYRAGAIMLTPRQIATCVPPSELAQLHEDLKEIDQDSSDTTCRMVSKKLRESWCRWKKQSLGDQTPLDILLLDTDPTNLRKALRYLKFFVAASHTANK